MGFTSRGAGMGFDLDDLSSGAKAAYDLHAYTGLTFWAKAASPMTMYVNFPDKDTDPAGGVCTGAGCNDHFGKGVAVTTTWTQLSVTFASLGTDGWGMPKPAAFDPAHVYSIQFHAAPSTAFDMWVDEISLVP